MDNSAGDFTGSSTGQATSDAKPIAELTFREAMLELEGIVQLLESGTLELEESLRKYARGVELLASLKEQINNAEQQINVLMGELSPAPDDETQDTTLLKA